MAGWSGRTARLWLLLVMTAGIVIGVTVGIQGPNPSVSVAVSVMTIIAGLLMMSPWMTTQPTDESQRESRWLVTALGASVALNGASQLVPNPTMRFTIGAANLLFMTAAVIRLRYLRSARRPPQ
jgi:uncharacterized membrane protein YfcA